MGIITRAQVRGYCRESDSGEASMNQKYTESELAIIERANREKAEVIDDMRRLTRKALAALDAMAQELPTDVAERIRREHGLSE